MTKYRKKLKLPYSVRTIQRMLKSLNFELKKEKIKEKKNGKGDIFIETTKNIAYVISRT